MGKLTQVTSSEWNICSMLELNMFEIHVIANILICLKNRSTLVIWLKKIPKLLNEPSLIGFSNKTS